MRSKPACSSSNAPDDPPYSDESITETLSSGVNLACISRRWLPPKSMVTVGVVEHPEVKITPDRAAVTSVAFATANIHIGLRQIGDHTVIQCRHCVNCSAPKRPAPPSNGRMSCELRASVWTRRAWTPVDRREVGNVRRCSRVAPDREIRVRPNGPSEQVRLDSRHPDLQIPPVPPRVFVDVHRRPPMYKVVRSRARRVDHEAQLGTSGSRKVDADVAVGA